MSSDGSSGSSASDSSGSEDEEQQHVHQVVTGANADPQVLQHFWDLASLQQEERQAAAEALVTALVDSQKQYDASYRAKGASPGGSFEQDAGNRQQRMEQCLSCCSPLMAYGLKRLARGLASSRQGARQGFAAAFAATLAHSTAGASTTAGQQEQLALQRPFVSAAGVLAVLDACLEVTGSMKGTEQRDALLGRVFGLAALTRSGLISALPAAAAADSTSTSCSPAAVLTATAVVAEQLAGLLQRKSFLRESAAAGLVELLQHLDQQQMGSVLQQAPKTLSLLHAAPASASPECLYLCLQLWHALPAQELQQCQLLPQLHAGQQPPPQVFWENPAAVKRKAVAAAAAAVFSADQVQRMTPALLLSTASSPRLHPVWGCLLALLVPGFTPVKSQETSEQKQSQKQQGRSPPEPQQLTALWHHFVEGACLSSSHERKALAVQLLQLLLPVMGPDMVPVLLCKQLLGCVATALKDKESYLHASAKRCLDRLSTAADHNLVVQDDPAAAARLRLALAAALQSANLSAPSSKVAKAAKQGPLQGLDAAGVAEYVGQTLLGLVQAAQGMQGKGAANGAAGADDESEDGGDVNEDDSKVMQQLEQLVSGLKLPAADALTLSKGLSFLAAVAWLKLPAGFDAAAAAGGSTKKGEKQKKKKQKQDAAAAAAAAGDAAAVLQQADVQEALQLAAGIRPGDTLRCTAAARLVGLLHHLHNRTNAAAAAAAHQKQPKQQQDGKQKQQAAAANAQQEARAAVHGSETLTVELLALFDAVEKLPGVSAAADEDIAEMVEQLGQLSAVIQQHEPVASAAADGSSQQQQQVAAAGRKRVVLHLVHQLRVQLLSGGLSAEAAGSVVDDLEVSVLRGLGLNGHSLEQLRAADAQAKLRMAGAAAEPSESEGDQELPAAGSSEDGSEGGSDGGDDDDDDDDDAWQDVLLDLLLSLLSSSEGGSGSKGGASVPTVPLREACEAVFKAFAEDMTAQGIADLLRVLSQRASEVLRAEDEEDDDGMEVEQSEGDGDESSGSEDDSSELDEEQQQSLKDLHKKSAAADSDDSSDDASDDSPDDSTSPTANGTASAKDGSKTTGSDSDSEGLDDEAMLRLDAQLGAAVRATLSRSGGSAKERAAALLALQLRVAALLEDWLKKCPRSPILLSAVLPLLKALVSARGPGGNPVLADRLAALVTKHLSRTRPAFPAAAAAAAAAATALEADARKVLYYASRDKDPRVAAAAAQSLLVLISAASEAGDAAAAAVAQATAAAGLQDYLQHKKTRLQQGWCQQLLARCFEAVTAGDAAGLQALLTACSKGRNEAVKAKAVQLLPSLATGRTQQQIPGLLAVLKQHQGLVASALAAGVVGPYKNKEQHAAAVKAVVALLGGVVKQGGGKRLAELVGSETVRELGKSVVVVKAAGVPPKVEGQLDRLVQTAALQQLVAAGKPDPARLALLNKARAALEAPAAAAAAAGGWKAGKSDKPKGPAANGGPAGAHGVAGGKKGGGQVQKGQQSGEQGKRKAKAAAADDGQQQQQPAGDQQRKKHKKQEGEAAAQQPPQQQQQRKQKQKHGSVAAGEKAEAAAAAAAAGSADKGSSKRKHTAEGGAEQGKGGKKQKGKQHKVKEQ